MRFNVQQFSRALLCALVATAVCSAATTAKAISFAIDSSQSSLSILVGAYDGELFVPFTTPQQPGSDTTSLNGTLDVLYGGATLGLGGGAIGFDNQPTDMEPLPGGTLPGAAPANYGLLIDLDGLVAGPAAGRGIGASVSLAPTLLLGNSFLADGALLSVIAGVLDVNLQGFTSVVDTLDISGNSGVNTGGLGTFDLVGQDGTITIPIYVEALVPVEVSPGFVLPLVAIFQGQIVATGLVPEPSTVVMLGMALVGLCVAGRRRLQR